MGSRPAASLSWQEVTVVALPSGATGGLRQRQRQQPSAGGGLPFNAEAAALLRAAAEIQAAASEATQDEPSQPVSPRGNHSFKKDPHHPPHRSELE